MTLKIRKQLVSNLRNSYGRLNKRRYITVHETGNTNRGADAQAHANLQSRGFTASFHYQVDDKEAIQSYGHDVSCWHAGDGRGNGNLNSIAVEICVNSDGDYAKAVGNAAKLVRKIMQDEGIPLANVVQHNRWSGKNCPSNLRSGAKGISWAEFIKAVEGEAPAKAVKPAAKPREKKKPAVKPSKQAYTGNSVVDYLKSIKVDSSIGNRRKLADKHGIKNYRGTPAQNLRLLGILRDGKAATSKPKPSKTITQMANEVLKGRHGNGHAKRRKSLGISKADYEKVRREVNRRL